MAILCAAADTLVSEGVIDTAHRDPPPIGEPAQRSDMLTRSEENDVIVTLADTPSQSNVTESPSNTTRPFQATRLLLAAAVADCDGVHRAAERIRTSRRGVIDL